MEPFGLLDEPAGGGAGGGPRAGSGTWWRCETGLPPDPPPGAVPRPGFDPAVTTLAQRDRAKAAELGVEPCGRCRRGGPAMPSRACGAWWTSGRPGSPGATGRADARLVAVVRDLVDAETGRLDRDAVAADPPGGQGGGGRAYGPGVVPLPGRTTFYKVIDAVAAGRHTFGSAVTRRQTANRPQGAFTADVRRPPG